MDALTKYYVRKANLKVMDEFHSEISSGDVEVLQKSRAYMLLCPVLAALAFQFILKLQAEGGMARHFNRGISIVR